MRRILNGLPLEIPIPVEFDVRLKIETHPDTGDVFWIVIATDKHGVEHVAQSRSIEGLGEAWASYMRAWRAVKSELDGGEE
jgi:hypothetical protein